jgi:hypothetical protein
VVGLTRVSLGLLMGLAVLLALAERAAAELPAGEQLGSPSR